MTFPSKYGSSEERHPSDRMLYIFIIAGFIGLTFLPVYFTIKGLFGPDASLYATLISTIVSGITGWKARFVFGNLLRR